MNVVMIPKASARPAVRFHKMPEAAGRKESEVKIILLIAGTLLVCLTFVWFFFFVPLGCSMNPTGCQEEFPVFSAIGLMHLWLPLAAAFVLILLGLRR